MAGLCLRHFRLSFQTAQLLTVTRCYHSPTICPPISWHAKCTQRTQQGDQMIFSIYPVPFLKAFTPRVSTTPRRFEYSKTSTERKEFTPFYYFPYIMPMKLFSRLKLGQTILTVSFVPALYVAEYYEIGQLVVDKSLTVVLATLALSMLYALGEFFRRLVGMMYLNRDETQVKASHLTFWGNRKDLIVPVSDIMPLRDCQEDKDIVNKLRRYSTNRYLLFSTRYGRVLNREKFEVVFGRIYQGEEDT